MRTHFFYSSRFKFLFGERLIKFELGKEISEIINGTPDRFQLLNIFPKGDSAHLTVRSEVKNTLNPSQDTPTLRPNRTLPKQPRRQYPPRQEPPKVMHKSEKIQYFAPPLPTATPLGKSEDQQ